MDQRRRDLKQSYRDRHPQMGILSVRCVPTGDLFLTPAADLPGKTNSVRFQLGAGQCPNKKLQILWNEHKADDFEWGVASELEYKDPGEDHKTELETLFELTMLEHEGAERISKSL